MDLQKFKHVRRGLDINLSHTPKQGVDQFYRERLPMTVRRITLEMFKFEHLAETEGE